MRVHTSDDAIVKSFPCSVGGETPKFRPMKWMKRVSTLLIFLLAGSLLVLGGGDAMGKAWWEASRESAGLAPDPCTVREAVVQVYAARAFSWRGAFGVHTWISVKPSRAADFTVYHVIGWRVRGGGNAVVIEHDIPDRLWFDAVPEILTDIRGPGVDAVISKIDAAARSYPYTDIYTLYPGPNSNTFIAWIARRVPELKLDLPPTAIGKDWLGSDGPVARAPSGTGYQFSLFGLAGILVGTEEGIEVNVIGLNFGVDPMGLAIRLPGIGRIGLGDNAKPRTLAVTGQRK
jgi:hypothetical protein